MACSIRVDLIKSVIGFFYKNRIERVIDSRLNRPVRSDFKNYALKQHSFANLLPSPSSFQNSEFRNPNPHKISYELYVLEDCHELQVKKVLSILQSRCL